MQIRGFYVNTIQNGGPSLDWRPKLQQFISWEKKKP